MSTIGNPNIENLRADIAVIGGGGAGLAAAIAAAEAGIKEVIVLEKAANPGGNAALSHGIFAINSPAQKRLGIKVSADEVFKRQMANSHWAIDPRLMRAFINISGDIIQLLEDKGMKFNCVVEFLPGEGSPKVFHMLEAGTIGSVGPKLGETLVKSCQDLGVRLLCKTSAKKILTDDKGRINGVMAKVDGKELIINAKSVIIAAGGFGGSKRMLNKYLARSGDIPSLAIPETAGDGLLMAAEVGAITDDNFSLSVVGPGYVGPLSLGLLVMRPELMLVNKNSERYSDEALFLNSHSWSGNALIRQPDKICYALLDEKIKQDIIQKRDSLSGFFNSIGSGGIWMDDLENDLQKEVDAGKVKASDSWEKIAGLIGLKPEALKATVEQYNLFCDQGYDADFLKDKRYLLPLRTPPYYAIPCGKHLDTAIGGIRINHRTEVLDKQVRPISGLYAAGDNTGWVQYYDHSYPGSGLGFALCSGYMAGKNAAEYIKTVVA